MCIRTEMHGLSCREPTAKDAILTQHSFKVCRLHKDFSVQFWGHGRKQHIIVNQGMTSHNIDVPLQETTTKDHKKPTIKPTLNLTSLHPNCIHQQPSIQHKCRLIHTLIHLPQSVSKNSFHSMAITTASTFLHASIAVADCSLFLDYDMKVMSTQK